MRMNISEGNITATSFMRNSSFLSVARQLLTTLTQYVDTSIAPLSDDNFVVAWQREQINGNLNIYARRYNAYGISFDDEFKVNNYPPSNQSAPVVSAFNYNSFVIAWQSYQQDGDDYGVFAQLYDSSASRFGDEFKVNTYTTGAQRSPSIAGFNDGNFIIAWQSYEQDGDDYGVYAQRYNSDGEPIDSEFSVNTYTAGPQENPSVATLYDGSFLIAWQSYRQDGDGYGIYARYFANDGTPGNELRISTDTSSWQVNPSITTWWDRTIIAWQSITPEGSESIYAQRYGADGFAGSSNEFKVNSYMTNHSQHPRATFLSDGSFAIVWRNNGQYDESGIYARYYDSNGISWENEFLVNINPTNDSGIPSIAASNYLSFAVAWQDYSQVISDRVSTRLYWVSTPEPTTEEPTTTAPPDPTTPSPPSTPTITPMTTLTPTPTIAPPVSSDADDNMVPLLAGLLCGGFGILVILALICYCCLKKRSSRINTIHAVHQENIALTEAPPAQGPTPEVDELKSTDSMLFLSPPVAEEKPKRIKREVTPRYFFPTPYVINENKNPASNPVVNPTQNNLVINT